MRKIFILLITVCLTSIIHAQKHGEMNEQFAKAQFNEIKMALALDDNIAKELEPDYINFMRELHAPRPPKKEPLERESEERIEERTRAKLAMAVNISTVREKYYDIFRKYLSPSQIVKMYQTERDIMRRVNHESGVRRGGGREKHEQ